MKYKKIHKFEDTGELENHLYKYVLKLPEHLADWDVWDYWEKERMASMASLLNKDSVLFDIGSEQGALTALYGKYITPNMVLVEPSAEFWPNIKQIWQANIDTRPLACYVAFANTKPQGELSMSFQEFPFESDGEIIDKMAYDYLHNNHRNIGSISIDSIVGVHGIPDGITIDVEGAELLVLQGAKRTLKEIKPLVWVSIHPDLIQRDYNSGRQEVFDFLQQFGYQATLLAVDHEEHYLFTPTK